MEVCKHFVYNLKLKARIHKDARRTCAGTHPFIVSPNYPAFHFNFLSDTFKSSYTCSSNCKDRSAFSFSLVNSISSFFWNCIPFFVHFMIFNIIFTNWKKSSKPYMKSYKTAFNSLCIKTSKHIFCKMKPRCRTGCRTSICCIHILIALRIFFCITTLDIWRKRNVAVTLKPVFINCKIKF